MEDEMTQAVLGYHSIIRNDVVSLIADSTFSQALEVGCGTGNTLGFLKEKNIIKVATGLEINPECSKYKNKDVDLFHTGNAENFDFKNKKYDLILLLDVLEHLEEPWSFLRKITPLLAQKGTLVISIPNINNLKILKDLIIKDRWDYSDSGILDRTHLRFFTQTSFMEQVLKQLPQIKIKKMTKNFEEIKFLKWLRWIPFFNRYLACQLLFTFEMQ